MSKLVYLAGPITGLSYGGAVDWREDATRQLLYAGIEALSPMRGKAYLKDYKHIGGTSKDHENFGQALSHGKGVVTRDRWDSMRADVVLMNLLGAERVSIGTMIEAGWADAARVPIVLVREDANVHNHAMLDQLAGFIVPTLEEGLVIVRALLM